MAIYRLSYYDVQEYNIIDDDVFYDTLEKAKNKFWQIFCSSERTRNIYKLWYDCDENAKYMTFYEWLNEAMNDPYFMDVLMIKKYEVE